METSLSISRRRQSSHTRENHASRPDRSFLVKRHRDGSRERVHILSDDDDIPTSKGEKHRRKKKHGSSSFNVPSNPGPRPGTSTDTFVERSQKPSKQKQGASRSNTDVPSNVVRPMQRGKREAPRESKHSFSKAPNAVVASDDEAGSQLNYSGPIATMEFNRMKRELEAYKKQVAAQNKSNEKQANTILSLKNELHSMHQTHNEQLSRVEILEMKARQADELTSNIEGTLQCQICIDTLTKPFALSPCGHVLCQGCLQDWFRNAPVPQDEMNVDEPLPLILRKKTCPFCRAVIRSRPLPLFVLKNLLSVLSKAKSKGATSVSETSPPPDLEDPWAGIFPSPSTQSDSESDAEDEDADLSENDYWGPFDVMYEDDDEDVEGLQEYDNTSDDEYEGEWNTPSWEPPAQRSVTPLDPEPATDALLRRGATYGMIERYDMQYTHQEGLTALVDDLCLYLGWNVELADEDEDGERFITWCLEDMEIRPYRWSSQDDGRVHRLMRPDTLEEYESTDSENWIGVEDDDDEDIGFH